VSGVCCLCCLEIKAVVQWEYIHEETLNEKLAKYREKSREGTSVKRVCLHTFTHTASIHLQTYYVGEEIKSHLKVSNLVSEITS